MEYDRIMSYYTIENISYELLHCGSFLVDEDFYDNGYGYTRIRVISYKSKLYYHKMVNGKCVLIKELNNA